MIIANGFRFSIRCGGLRRRGLSAEVYDMSWEEMKAWDLAQ